MTMMSSRLSSSSPQCIIWRGGQLDGHVTTTQRKKKKEREA
jgi:hypothetical protein